MERASRRMDPGRDEVPVGNQNRPGRAPIFKAPFLDHGTERDHAAWVHNLPFSQELCH